MVATTRRTGAPPGLGWVRFEARDVGLGVPCQRARIKIRRQQVLSREDFMRFSTAVLAPVLSIGLIAPALAQELDQQTRQQIEAIHTKWIDAINSGDAKTVMALSAPNVISIDAFGRTMPSRIAELVEMVHKKGVMLSFPIEGIEPIKDGTVVA
jgi:hypothetical protein